MTENKVELHCAYVWDCPECGGENFCRAVTVEQTPEDIDHLVGEYGGDPSDWQTGQWMTRPDEVTCAHCGQEYETTEWEGPTKESLG